MYKKYIKGRRRERSDSLYKLLIYGVSPDILLCSSWDKTLSKLYSTNILLCGALFQTKSFCRQVAILELDTLFYLFIIHLEMPTRNPMIPHLDIKARYVAASAIDIIIHTQNDYCSWCMTCALRANNERKGVQNPSFKKSMDSV